jgi:hypothetical protein
MRIIPMALAAALAVSAVTTLLPASNVAAAAKVVDVKKCTILDGNKNLYATTKKNKAVYNKAGDILKCSAKGIPHQKKAVHWSKANTGYVCSTGQHVTDDWKITVSAKGNATLTCKFKN